MLFFVIILTVSLPHYPARPCRPQGGFGLVIMMRKLDVVDPGHKDRLRGGPQLLSLAHKLPVHHGADYYCYYYQYHDDDHYHCYSDSDDDVNGDEDDDLLPKVVVSKTQPCSQLVRLPS